MRVLVLDTIHGGSVLADALRSRGDTVDAVDVYRNSAFPAELAAQKTYDLTTAPVHLDPAYPLLQRTPVLTHHELTGRLVTPPKLSIEITGARGKTTTAFAVAHILDGPGVLHTSSGTFLYPSREFLFKKSITPASVIPAAAEALRHHADWLVAEESAGVCGFGTLGILTSDGDYPIAAGKRSALAAKRESLRRCRSVLVPDGIPKESGWYAVGDLVSVRGDTLFWDGGEIHNPLLTLSGYRSALATAAAAGVLLGLPVERLGSFEALPGRMHLSLSGDVPVLDNAGSGTNADNAIEAAAYLRRQHPSHKIVLVIGMEEHAVCEGFPPDEIVRAVRTIGPARLILISGADEVSLSCPADAVCRTLAEAKETAFGYAEELHGSILFAVKTWR